MSSSNNDPEAIANEVFENTPEIGATPVEDEDENDMSERLEEIEDGEGVNKEVAEEEAVDDADQEMIAGEDSDRELEGEAMDMEEEVIPPEDPEEELPSSVNEEPTKFEVAKNNVVAAINNVLERVNEGLVNVNRMFKNKPNKSEFMNGNISTMAAYQENLYEDEKYLEYLNYLKIFFEREKKKSQYNKSYVAGKLVLTNKTNKNQKVTITPPVIVDIDTYKTYLHKEIEVVLFKIVTLIESYTMTTDEQKAEFAKLKSLYITFKGQLNQIEGLETGYEAKVASLEDQIATAATQLNVMKEGRQESYQRIIAMGGASSGGASSGGTGWEITSSLKETLITRFKENGLKPLDLNAVQEISREHEVPVERVEAWLAWIAKSAEYVDAQRKYSELLRVLRAEEHNHYQLMKNFIIQKPVIEFS